MAGASEPGPMSTRRQRLAELAKRAPQMAFTSLNHHLDLGWLAEAYHRTRKDAAPGVDGLTAEEYSRDLLGNLRVLLDRAKSGLYRAPPVRRVHIPKGTGNETRPLGVPMIRAYCTPYQKPWGLGPCLSPGSSRVQASIRADGRCDDRFFQRRRTGFRSRSMTSGDSRTHHGPCAVARMPSSCPDSHQAAMVDTSTFSAFAAAWAEQRPSPRLPPGQAAGASGQPLAMSWT